MGQESVADAGQNSGFPPQYWVALTYRSGLQKKVLPPSPALIHSTSLCTAQPGGVHITKIIRKKLWMEKSLPYKLAELFRTCRKQGI